MRECQPSTSPILSVPCKQSQLLDNRSAVLRGQRSSAKIKNKMCVFPSFQRMPSTHLRRGTGRARNCSLIPVILPWQKHSSMTAASLAVFHWPAVQSSGQEAFTLPLDSFSTQEALQVHSRLASSVDKGDRSDSVTVTMFIYGKHILLQMVQKSYSIQATGFSKQVRM